MPLRNNVTRLLDARKIKYELFEFSPEKHTAEETAALLGVPKDHVYKTLVVLREGKGGSRARPLLAMVPAGRELNLKVLAASLGEKKLKMATQREAEKLTGLQVGGISALALLNRGFEICIERAALALPPAGIHISAGQRGANIRMEVQDLINLTGARLVETSGND